MERKYIDAYVRKWVSKHYGEMFKFYYARFPKHVSASREGAPIWLAPVVVHGRKVDFKFYFYGKGKQPKVQVVEA